jgi:L-ascorbate metabolism protein UlaG (beta-lactamase superfamily)
MLLEYEGFQVSWTGHDGFRIVGSDNHNRQRIIYIDPYQLSNKYQSKNDADIVLVSHDHFDHMSIDDLRQIINDDTSIIAAKECVEKLKELKMNDVKGMKPGEKIIAKDLSIEAVHAYNTNKKFHPKSDDKVGFVISITNNRIYHAGDTDLIPEMESIRPDIAFVPVSGTYVMNAEEAAKAVNELLRPKKIALPMHYGSIVGTEADAKMFKNLVLICRVEILPRN